MVKPVYDFSDYEVLDWYEFQNKEYYLIEEVVSLLLGLDWNLCRRYIFEYPDIYEANPEVRKLKSVIDIKKRELEGFEEELPNMLVEYSIKDGFKGSDFGLDKFYTKESIKAFLLKCYPNERPRFLYPDAEPMLPKEDAEKAELRKLRASVKQLQKLVLGLAMHQHDYDPTNKSMFGKAAFEAILQNAEEDFNKKAKAMKKAEIKITLAGETIKKYLEEAYEGVKVK